jgi:hypothetical protein
LLTIAQKLKYTNCIHAMPLFFHNFINKQLCKVFASGDNRKTDILRGPALSRLSSFACPRRAKSFQTERPPAV